MSKDEVYVVFDADTYGIQEGFERYYAVRVPRSLATNSEFIRMRIANSGRSCVAVFVDEAKKYDILEQIAVDTLKPKLEEARLSGGPVQQLRVYDLNKLPTSALDDHVFMVCEVIAPPQLLAAGQVQYDVWKVKRGTMGEMLTTFENFSRSEKVPDDSFHGATGRFGKRSVLEISSVVTSAQNRTSAHIAMLSAELGTGKPQQKSLSRT
jgi:hypothetical protein